MGISDDFMVTTQPPLSAAAVRRKKPRALVTSCEVHNLDCPVTAYGHAVAGFVPGPNEYRFTAIVDKSMDNLVPLPVEDPGEFLMRLALEAKGIATEKYDAFQAAQRQVGAHNVAIDSAIDLGITQVPEAIELLKLLRGKTRAECALLIEHMRAFLRGDRMRQTSTQQRIDEIIRAFEEQNIHPAVAILGSQAFEGLFRELLASGTLPLLFHDSTAPFIMSTPRWDMDVLLDPYALDEWMVRVLPRPVLARVAKEKVPQ